VILLGSDGQTYRLAGAAWFGGTFGPSGGNFTDTEFFSIVAPGGGVVAKVSIVAHFTMNAQGVITVEFEKNRGTCVPPED
jgi:3-deoxy-D-manno-octulosonic-acid transferase